MEAHRVTDILTFLAEGKDKNTVRMTRAKSAQASGNWKSGGGSRGKADSSAVYAVTVNGKDVGFAMAVGGSWAIFPTPEWGQPWNRRLSRRFFTRRDLRNALVDGSALRTRE
jgi:hypothetical protein